MRCTTPPRYSSTRRISILSFGALLVVLLLLAWKEVIQLILYGGGGGGDVQSRLHYDDDGESAQPRQVVSRQQQQNPKTSQLNADSWNLTATSTYTGINDDSPSTNDRLEVTDTADMSSRLSKQYQYPLFDVENPRDCILTVVILDPRIAVFPADGLFYTKTMESVAEYTPVGTCIVFHTSSCRLQEYLQQGVDLKNVNFIDDMAKSKKMGVTIDSAVGYVPPLNETTDRNNGGTTQQDVIRAMARNVYNRAGPWLRSVIEKGRVRLSILRHDEYGLRACDNFYNPKQLFMSASFWVNEFHPKQDADLVLNVERDVFLCKPLTFTTVLGNKTKETWSKYAFVGAPWRPRVGGGVAQLRAFTRHDLERQYPKHNPTYSVRKWSTYWNDQEKYYTGYVMMNDDTTTAISCLTLHDRVNQVLCPLPLFPADLTWPEKYPLRQNSFKVGNGGFSLRSRRWMIRAIRACPDLEFSGLFPKGINTTRSENMLLNSTTCTATRLFDDVYFSLVIQLIGGIVPSPEQAVQFSGGMLWANDVLNVNRTKSKSEYSIASIGGDEGVKAYWHEMRTIGTFLPIGYHKCHYQSYECPERRHCKYSFKNEGEGESSSNF